MSLKSPHLDPVWLRQKYETEGLSTYEIGTIVRRDPKRIYEKLRDFGITTRPRGQNLAAGDCFMLKPGQTNPFLGRKHSEETRRVLSEKASVPKPYICGARNGMAGRTGASNPRYRDGSSPERQRLYASGEWKELVRQVYRRDGFKCMRCGEGKCGVRGLHAHHIRPWAGNPTFRFDITNIATLCRACHEWVHSKDNKNHDFLG